MDFETFESYDFTFRAIDQDGVMCRYDAVLAFSLSEDGPTYLVYVDADPHGTGDGAMYASILVDPSLAASAQAAVDSGSRPKKPPVLELIDPSGQEEWDMIYAVLDDVLEGED